jgi:type IV secretion system protein VirB3
MSLERDPVFAALTRPQMFAGVSYSFFILNFVTTTEVFLISRSFWVIAFALIVHGIGYLMCLREPRWLDLWILKVSRCPRVPNFSHWRCNSYSPGLDRLDQASALADPEKSHDASGDRDASGHDPQPAGGFPNEEQQGTDSEREHGLPGFDSDVEAKQRAGHLPA